MGGIRGHAGTAECRGALRLARNPSTPGSQPALPPGGGERERLLGAPVPRPPQVGETVRGAGPPSAAPLPSAAFPSLSGSLRPRSPPPGSEAQAAPRSRLRGAPSSGRQPGGAAGRAPGLAVSSQGPHTRAPSSWSVSASLCRYVHAQGRQRPNGAGAGPGRASRRSHPGLTQPSLHSEQPPSATAPPRAPPPPPLCPSRAHPWDALPSAFPGSTIRAQSTPPPPGSLPGLI